MHSYASTILITGAGLITPLGLSRQAAWEAVRQGRCGMGALGALEQPLPPGSTGGQAPDLPENESPEYPREVRYLGRAIAEALADAGLDRDRPYPADRCGFMLGTTLHGVRAGGRYLREHDFAVLRDFLAGATLRNATRQLPFSGFAATVCSACSSSLGSIAMGAALLRAGRLDLVIAGGYDTISEYVYGGFNSLRLVSPGALRPFTRGRQGMKLAEGYGIVVLERAEEAARRGTKGMATLLGYGESADAHHLTQPHPRGEGAARAMAAALAHAGLRPDEIDLIAAHATGTPDNDAGEYAAMSSVFGAELARIPVIAFKSHLGHTLGGAGAVELILSALCLRDQVAPACANVDARDIEFSGLNVSTGDCRNVRIRATLNTSLGFGGANTCMVLGPVSTEEQPPAAARRAPDVSSAGQSAPRDVFITGVGVVLPGAIGNEAFVALLNRSEPRRVTSDTGIIAESELANLLSARRVRRMSDYVKLSLAATMLACRDAGIADLPEFARDCSAVLGSAHGATNYSEVYYRQIVEEGVLSANPLLFAEGVPNAAAAHLSLMLSLKGPCQTVVGTRTAGLDAMNLAAMRIASGEWDRAVVGAAEEYSAIINAAYKRWGLYRGASPSAPFARARCKRGECAQDADGGDLQGAQCGSATGFSTGSGAVTLILESAQSLERRGGRALGRLIAGSGPGLLPFAGGRRAAQLVDTIQSARHVLSSANGTSIDRLEAAALARGGERVVSSLAGHIAETFSVMPLAGIAAFLLNRRLPPLLGEPPGKLLKSSGNETIERAGFICSDYTRLLSAACVERALRQNEVA